MLRERGVESQSIILGVRPEHVTLAEAGHPDTITGTINVNEMMGSELHLHIVNDNGEKMIVRIPTINLEDEQRKQMVFGSKLHITFEGKVMHFFDTETEMNLLA